MMSIAYDLPCIRYSLFLVIFSVCALHKMHEQIKTEISLSLNEIEKFLFMPMEQSKLSEISKTSRHVQQKLFSSETQLKLQLWHRSLDKSDFF